jgi:hypothetical protein
MKRSNVNRSALPALVAAFVIAGCGEDEFRSSKPAKPKPATATATAATGGYKPVSDVDAHGAIGLDMAAIRAALEAKDYAAAAEVWEKGKNSKKEDGSVRTLGGFVEGDQTGRLVVQALEGNGAAVDLNDEQRRQWVDKGMLAALEAKVLDEVDTAIEKAGAGETDAAEGAPHNVDEAWAFFAANGEGLAATAAKREADFEGAEIVKPAVAALSVAQKAAVGGDANALKAAREDLRGAMNRMFALAVTKYANEAVEDEVAAAEGAAFAWGLRGDLPEPALGVVEGAFEKPGFKKALAVREALNEHLGELGLDEKIPAYAG